MKVYLVFDIDYGIGPFPRCLCATEPLDKAFDQYKLIGFIKDET